MPAGRDDLADDRTPRQRLVDALFVERFGPYRPTTPPIETPDRSDTRA